MSIIWTLFHEIPSKERKEYLVLHFPEFVNINLDFSSDSIYGQLTSSMSEEFSKEFQKYALQETDETKLSIILSAYKLRETFSILLYRSIDRDIVADFLKKAIEENNYTYNRVIIMVLMPSVVANDDEENFLNLVNMDDIGPIQIYSIRKFYVALKYNKSAVRWLRDIQKGFRPITYLISLAGAVVDSPEAIIWSKYVYDFVMEVGSYSSGNLRIDFYHYISNVAFGNVKSKILYYEILFQTGYFSYQYLSDLYKENGDPVLKEWLGMTDI